MAKKELQQSGKGRSVGDSNFVASLRHEMDAMLDRVARLEHEILDAPFFQGLSVFPHEGRLELRPFGSLLDVSAIAEGWREPLLNWELEDNKRLLVNIELPGAKKEDINLDVGPDHLRLECESPNSKYKAFLEPGMSLDPGRVKTQYEDGVLSLAVELNAEPAKRVRHIPIE